MGWEEATPLEFDEITRQEKTLNPRPLDGVQGSFVQIDDPDVLLDTLKPAEDQEGTILRFLDLGGPVRRPFCLVSVARASLWGFVEMREALKRQEMRLGDSEGQRTPYEQMFRVLRKSDPWLTRLHLC
jgi:hypothetical protein